MASPALITFVSEDYQDTLHLTIPSWLRVAACMIVIYTDFDPSLDRRYTLLRDPRVKVERCFEPVNWVECSKRQYQCAMKFMYEHDNPFAFLDADCYVMRDFLEVFETGCDLAATRMYTDPHSYTGGTSTSGVFFAQNNERTMRFLEVWEAMSLEYESAGLHSKPYAATFAQYAFSGVLHSAHATGEPCSVARLDEHIYNCEHSDIEKWKKLCAEHKPAIIHFKGRSFRNDQFREEMIQLATA